MGRGEREGKKGEEGGEEANNTSATVLWSLRNQNLDIGKNSSVGFAGLHLL